MGEGRGKQFEKKKKMSKKMSENETIENMSCRNATKLLSFALGVNKVCTNTTKCLTEGRKEGAIVEEIEVYHASRGY